MSATGPNTGEPDVDQSEGPDDGFFDWLPSEFPRPKPRAIQGFVAFSPFAAVIAVFVYAIWGDTGNASAGSVLAVGCGVTGSALAVGVMIGFLFGLPKTVDRPSDQARLATNTNLDQISDWLTKILVGLGLVQLNKIAHAVSSVAHSIAPGLGGQPGAVPFAVALLIYSTVIGFLLGYLWTRIDLSERFRTAVQDLELWEKVLDRPIPDPPEPPFSGDE